MAGTLCLDIPIEIDNLFALVTSIETTMGEPHNARKPSSLIARAFQIEALQSVLADVRGGRGHCVLVTGEAGVGKSRLLREFREGAVESGVLAMQGNCLETDPALSFAPVVDALRRCLSARPSAETADLLGPLAPELVKLLPELGLTLPGLKPTPPLAPESEKRRLFEVLVQFMSRLATHGPLLLIIEDIHWSDDTSLEFLHTLARRSTSLPILILLTTRPEPQSPAVSQFLAQMHRERLAQEIHVPPLSRDAVDALLRSMFDWDRPVNRSLLDAIYELTEGNPFFVEEVATTLVSTGDIFVTGGLWQAKPLTHLPIPHSLRLIVQQRTNRLSPPAADLLALAAVAGHKFDFELLAWLTAQDEESLLALIKELIAMQLVAEETPDTFAFRHALTREAIYSGLLSREQRHWHKAIADYYERQGEMDAAHLPLLAYHFYAAGDWEKALHYGGAAGIQACQNFAPHAALAHFAHVAEAASRLALPLPQEVLRQRGQAQQMVGNFESALADFEVTLNDARATGDRRAEWQALYDLGFLWMARDYARTRDYLQEALARARALNDSATLAHSLNRLGNWNANVGRPLDALALHEEALSIFESLGDTSGLASTHDLIATAHGITGNIAASTNHYRRALPLFESLGNRQGMASSLTMLTTNGSIADGERAVEIAREIGWRDGEAYAHLRLSTAHAFLGSIDAALQHCKRGLDIAREIDHVLWQMAGYQNLTTIHYLILALDKAEAYATETLQKARASGAQIWADSSLSLLVLIRLARGNISGASEALSEAQTPIASAETLSARLLAWAHGEMALALRRPEEALAIVETVMAALPQLRQWEDRTLPLLCQVQARALLALGRLELAVAVFKEAIGLCQDYSLRPFAWRNHADLARLHLVARDRAAAETELAAAHHYIAEVAETIPDEALRRNFQQAAGAYLPVLPRLTPLQQSKQAFGGLTRREQQIALLVARGKSNKDIAAELFISVHTTKTHITGILTKLNLASRTQLAAWVIEKQLLN
jgi:DNA-binding CsgD family transcriptional regulator